MQAFSNLKNKLGALVFKEGSDWDAYARPFFTTRMQLAGFDAELSDEDNASSLITSVRIVRTHRHVLEPHLCSL